MITGLNHITLAVSDVGIALHFYSEILGFNPEVKWGMDGEKGGAYLSMGALWLCLSKDQPVPSQDYSHIALSVSESDFAAVSQRIKDSGAKIWKPNKSEGDSLYFLDPDGHKLEIHVGNLQQRLKSLKQAPYQGLVWLNDT